MRRGSSRIEARLVLALIGLCLAQGVRAENLKADPALATAMAGSYLLSSINGGRECRFQLGAERSDAGFRLFLPPGCRNAFPFLRPSINWSLDEAGNLEILGPNATVLANFILMGESYMELRDANGVATHQLASTESDWASRRKQALGEPEVVAEPAAPTIVPAVEPPKPVPTAPSDMEGWYQVIRSKGQAADCRLALLSAETGETGKKAAALDERCKDKGMLIFRPVAWRMEGDTLILTARRGHELAMARQGEVWTKVVASGEVLQLSRMP